MQYRRIRCLWWCQELGPLYQTKQFACAQSLPTVTVSVWKSIFLPLDQTETFPRQEQSLRRRPSMRRILDISMFLVPIHLPDWSKWIGVRWCSAQWQAWPTNWGALEWPLWWWPTEAYIAKTISSIRRSGWHKSSLQSFCSFFPLKLLQLQAVWLSSKTLSWFLLRFS